MEDRTSQVLCPGCQAVLAVTAGMQVRCGACHTVFVAPLAAQPPPLPSEGHLPDDAAGNLDEDGQFEQPYTRSRSPLSTAIVLYGLIVLLLTAGGVLAWYVVADKSKPAIAGRGSSAPTPRVRKGVVDVAPSLVVDSTPPRWSDASRVSLRSHRIKVRVKQVEIGAVRGKDLRGTVIITGTKNFLQVFLNIKNHAPEPCKYISWYGNTFQFGGVERAAELTDNEGRRYAMMAFTDVSSVRGHTPTVTLEALDEVDDVVIFVIPPEVDSAAIEDFHLELPGAALGNPDSYRFRIPRSMIQTQ